MNIKRLFETQESKDNRIVGGLLFNAFRSVEVLMQEPFLYNSCHSSIEKARCRLNLYAMNAGYLGFLVFSKFRTDNRVYVKDLLDYLVSTIFKSDTEIVDSIEEIILDKELILRLRDKKINKTADRVTSKVGLLEAYLFNRANEYHTAIEEKITTMINSNPNMVNPDLIIDQAAKLFSVDYLGIDYMENYEFAFEFTNNISMFCFKIFSEEVDKLAA